MTEPRDATPQDQELIDLIRGQFRDAQIENAALRDFMVRKLKYSHEGLNTIIKKYRAAL